MLSTSAQNSVQYNWPDVLLQALLGSRAWRQDGHRMRNLHSPAANVFALFEVPRERRFSLFVIGLAGTRPAGSEGSGASAEGRSGPPLRRCDVPVVLEQPRRGGSLSVSLLSRTAVLRDACSM